MTADLDTIAKRINYRLIVLGLKVPDLERRLSRSATNPTVRNWCAGRNTPETLALPSLCRVLGCSIDWLLTGTEHSPLEI